MLANLVYRDVDFIFVLVYTLFCSTEEKAVGFSFLVDLRLASWAEIKPVMKLIQVCFINIGIHVYV